MAEGSDELDLFEEGEGNDNFKASCPGGPRGRARELRDPAALADRLIVG